MNHSNQTINLSTQNMNQSQMSLKSKAASQIQRALKRVEQGKLLKPGTVDRYVQYLRTKEPRKPLEKHHILPKHMGGSNSSENLISINTRDHILVHLLLFLEYGNRGNLLAYTFRKSTEHFDFNSHGKKMAALNQLLGRSFWNPEVQRELGKRGGSLGGSKNTDAQLKARQQVGKTYGRNVGLGNQSQTVKELLKNIFVFENTNAPNEFFFIGPCKAIIDLARNLNEECDKRGMPQLKIDEQRVKKGGTFYKLIKSERPTYLNWKIIQIYDPSDLSDFDD